jgi:hypothetical protein
LCLRDAVAASNMRVLSGCGCSSLLGVAAAEVATTSEAFDADDSIGCDKSE